LTIFVLAADAVLGNALAMLVALLADLPRPSPSTHFGPRVPMDKPDTPQEYRGSTRDRKVNPLRIRWRRYATVRTLEHDTSCKPANYTILFFTLHWSGS
jgi:hypothetical protein